jgi:hypothetical protein
VVNSKAQSSPILEELLYRFTHLPIGGKEIRCPYWRNQPRKLITGLFGGKGTPAEIIRVTNDVARKQGENLLKMTKRQVGYFMKKNRIGIDCSGFIYQLLDGLDKEKGGDGIGNDVYGVRGRGIRRTNAYCLTNNRNTIPIRSVKQVRPGDLVRLHRGKHAAVVIRVNRDKRGELRELVYAHSCPWTKISGVHTGRIIVKNENKGIRVQQWVEKTREGKDYKAEFFFPQKGDGVRRLKIWA